MNGIGNDFHPSIVEDIIYEVLDEHSLSLNTYERTAGPAIMTLLENSCIQFNIIEDPYPDMTGASVSVCWIENGHLHHLVFNVCY